MTGARLFIDGVWRGGSTSRGAPVINPATEAVAGQVAYASPDDVDAAIAAAYRGLQPWRATSAEHRGTILRQAARGLAERVDAAAVVLTMEQGKPLVESRAELTRAIETLVWHADEGPRICEPRAAVRPEPLGVVAAFTPWNYPAVIMARKLGAALSAGCTVVLKAAEETPGIACTIVEALQEAGIPPGVVNLVFGDPPVIASRLLDAPEVRALSFTGSTAVGKQLATQAGASLKRCVLELGGHAPVLVFADADIPAAVSAIAAYKFECAGQSCNAPSRIYVHQSVYRQFLDAFVVAASRLRVGDGLHASTDMGPLAHTRRLAAMERLVADGQAHGACVHLGGTRLERPGWFWPPTVLTEVGEGAAILTEEPFGPIVPVWPFATFDEAIDRANATAYGLAAYVFTGSPETANAAARELAAGSIGINQLRGVPADVGIAGIKESGYGYEGGWLGVESFLNLKVVRGNETRIGR